MYIVLSHFINIIMKHNYITGNHSRTELLINIKNYSLIIRILSLPNT